MSTTATRKHTINEIAARVGEQLGLTDMRRVSLALAEVAAQEAERNHLFAERIRTAYAAVAPTRQRTPTVTAFDVQLVPIKQVQGREINPAAPLDPYFLLEVYGPHQLQKALSIFPMVKLKEGAALVAQRNPGTKPNNSRQKQSLIDYITQQVTSADAVSH